LFASCALLAGCATFNETEMGIIKGSGASPRVVAKMQEGDVLTPDDVIELTRRRVPERYIIRQIEDAGLDYALRSEDIQRMKKAKVSPLVVNAMIEQSELGRYYAGPHRAYVGNPYYYDPYYYGPGYYYGPRPYYGSVGVRVYPHRHYHYWHNHH